MTTRTLKQFIEDYRQALGLSISDGEQIYIEMLENYMNDKEVFNTEFAEIKSVAQEWVLNN